MSWKNKMWSEVAYRAYLQVRKERCGGESRVTSAYFPGLPPFVISEKRCKYPAGTSWATGVIFLNDSE